MNGQPGVRKTKDNMKDQKDSIIPSPNLHSSPDYMLMGLQRRMEGPKMNLSPDGKTSFVQMKRVQKICPRDTMQMQMVKVGLAEVEPAELTVDHETR